MKKKLLLVGLMIAIFVFLFALSASAATYYYYENSVAEENKLYYIETEFEGRGKFELTTAQGGVGFAKTNEAGDPLTWYVTSDTTDENDVRHIVVKAIKTIGEAGTIDANGLYTYGTGTVADVTSKNVVSTNFFGTEVKTLSKGAFMATASTPVHNSEYYEIADGSYLLCLYLPKTLTAIPDQLCYRCPVKVLEFEDNKVTYDTIPLQAFQFCGLERLVIPEGIKTIQERSFRENCSLAYIKFPSTMTTLVNNVFFRCNAIETVVFGENMTQIGCINSDCVTMGQTGSGKGGQGLAIKYMYVPNTINAASKFDAYRGLDNASWSGLNISIVFLFAGTLEEANVVANYDDKHFGNAIANAVEYSVYINNRETYDNYDSTQHVLVYNVPKCVAFYDNTHDISSDDGDCTTPLLCSRCNIILEAAEDAHDYVIVIEYPDGYLDKGVKRDGCIKCGDLTEEDTEPLFTCLGYSTRADGKGGLTAGYQIHKEALDEYLALNPTLTIGLIIVNADTVGETIIDSDGALTGKGVKIENISTKYSVVNISIDGFNVENAKNLDLAMALYVKDENGYQYMQAEKDSSYYETRSFGNIKLEVVTLYNVANKNGVETLTLSDGSITIS